MLRLCRTCGKLLTANNFYYSKGRYTLDCRPCFRAARSAWDRVHRANNGPDRGSGRQRKLKKCKVHPECARIDRAEVLRRGAGICGICGRKVRPQWHMDHIKPVNKGGIHCYLNLQPSHERCNLRKGDKYPFIILRKDPDVRTP